MSLQSLIQRSQIIGAIIIALVVLSILIGSSIADAHTGASRQYAWANLQQTNGYKGVAARIETAIPTVRDGVGGFSSEVIWLSQGGNAHLIETGWRTTDFNASPRWYSSRLNSSSGIAEFYWEGNPTVGHAYDYKIENYISGSWKIIINGSWVRTLTNGYSTASRVQAGGEVTKFSASVNNAMGVSGFDFIQYKSASSGTWNYWGPWSEIHKDVLTGYALAITSDWKFQNSGNNP